MNSNKNNTANMDEDLKFVPLNIQEPFKSKDSSWVPFINIDVDTDNMTNNFFIGLSNLQPNQGFTQLPNINTNPILPYPQNIESPDVNNLSNTENINNVAPLTNSKKTIKNILLENELSPSELLTDELYSYNEATKISNRDITNLTHLDILRDFDLFTDFENVNNSRVCCAKNVDTIFRSIEENDSGLLSTLQTYKVPYPITSLIVKKIIKITLDNNKV